MKNLVLMFAASLLIAANCGGSNNPDAGDASRGVSQACYTASMFRCDEEPNATTAQQMNAPVVCSSASGVWTTPAACPTAGFMGKCTLPPASTMMDGVQIQRFYQGADVAYAADYCVNTSHGTWSTTF